MLPGLPKASTYGLTILLIRTGRMYYYVMIGVADISSSFNIPKKTGRMDAGGPEGSCLITVRIGRTYTVKAPAVTLTSANYEKKRRNYTKNPPITLARIQQYRHFA